MTRFRNLRTSQAIRNLLRETQLTRHDFVQPFFVIEGKNREQAVASMPGISRYTVELLLKSLEKYIRAGGQAGLFFGLPATKDPQASQAYHDQGIIQKAVRAVKKEFPQFYVMTDVCLCAYTDHGHCGVVDQQKIDNDLTLPLLAKTAVSHAQAGSDMVAPSDMMDFRVAHIRKSLDQNHMKETAILSYAVKYASAFYGPFREAADSTPSFGDRNTYQMDGANAREALKEAAQDVAEGADVVMVKPAMAYLDVIRLLKNHLNVPLAAYQVSGEYAMIKAAAQQGWIDEQKVVLEILTSLKRAGSSIIFTYYAERAMNWIQ